VNNFYRNTPLFGKCLGDFISWYENVYKDTHVHAVCYWDEIPFTMQYTVYVDFFLYNNIKVELKESGKKTYHIVINNKVSLDVMPLHLARLDLIKEAGELYNSNDLTNL